MDIKHVFSCNPLLPAYRLGTAPLSGPASEPLRWIDVSPDPIQDLGVDPGPFSFDNEGPRHQALVRPFRLADRLATEGEWLAFMEDGGYRRAELWLSEGWATVQAQGWSAPLYWHQVEDQWQVFTLGGARPLLEATPVTHVSYFEADAFARWSGRRLATEAEWEVASRLASADDAPNDLGAGALHPRPAPVAPRPGVRQLFGDGWEWTASPWCSYPGAEEEFSAPNMPVLRGGSWVDDREHLSCAARKNGHPYINFGFRVLLVDPLTTNSPATL